MMYICGYCLGHFAFVIAVVIEFTCCVMCLRNFIGIMNCLLAFSVILVMFINIFIFPCFFFRYNLQSDVRAAMYEEAEKWMRAVGRRKFMGGSAPNLADLVLLYYFTEIKSDHNTTHFWVNKYSETPGLQYRQFLYYSCIVEVVQSISLLLVFSL